MKIYYKNGFPYKGGKKLEEAENLDELKIILKQAVIRLERTKQHREYVNGKSYAYLFVLKNLATITSDPDIYSFYLDKMSHYKIDGDCTKGNS